MPFPHLERVEFDALNGFADDDAVAAFAAFARVARALVEDSPALRAARPTSAGLRAAAAEALDLAVSDAESARAFFRRRFQPFRVAPPGSPHGFLTGYYEPVVKGSFEPSPGFQGPVLARPEDLVSFAPGEGPAGFDPTLAGARRLADGTLEPYPTRAEIEGAKSAPLIWLQDAVEVFLMQVQGSARVELPDGRRMRLVYDGRNGRPYTSIGRLLVESGEIPLAEMSLATLKAWLRAHGLQPGDRGRALMQRNASYIFFRLAEDPDPALGPTGGAGTSLDPLRSIAIDRTVWSEGLPFWIEAVIPWRDEAPKPFRRLMIAADTGTAIVGPARADIFFGTGDEAGRRAGAVRHGADFVVFLPAGEGP